MGWDTVEMAFRAFVLFLVCLSSAVFAFSLPEYTVPKQKSW